MNTVTTLQIDSAASKDTFALGVRLGQKCKGGELFLLASDLGGGKTTFTKGLAEGLDSKNVVSSPTFMVSKVYDCRDGLTLHHFDFYRLSEGGMVGLELADIIDDPKAVIAVEWADVVADQLPNDRITIEIRRTALNEDARIISVQCPPNRAYIFS